MFANRKIQFFALASLGASQAVAASAHALDECRYRRPPYFTADGGERDYRDAVFMIRIVNGANGAVASDDANPATDESLDRSKETAQLTGTLFHIDADGYGYLVTAMHDLGEAKKNQTRPEFDGRDFKNGRIIATQNITDGLSGRPEEIQLPDTAIVGVGDIILGKCGDGEAATFGADCRYDISLIRINLRKAFDGSGRAVDAALDEMLSPIGIRFDLPSEAAPASFSGYGNYIERGRIYLSEETKKVDEEVERKLRHGANRFQRVTVQAMRMPPKGEFKGRLVGTAPALRGHSGSLLVEHGGGMGFAIVVSAPPPISKNDFNKDSAPREGDQEFEAAIEADLLTSEFVPFSPLGARKAFNSSAIGFSSRLAALLGILQSRPEAGANPAPLVDEWRLAGEPLLDCIGGFETLQLYGAMTRPGDAITDFTQWKFFTDNSSVLAINNYDNDMRPAGFEIVRKISRRLATFGLNYEAAELIDRAGAARRNELRSDDVDVVNSAASKLLDGGAADRAAGRTLAFKAWGLARLAAINIGMENSVDVLSKLENRDSVRLCQERAPRFGALAVEYGRALELQDADLTRSDTRSIQLQRIFAEAAACDPSNPAALGGLARVFAQSGKTDLARDFEAAAEAVASPGMAPADTAQLPRDRVALSGSNQQAIEMARRQAAEF